MGEALASGGTGVQGTGRYGVWGESNQAGFYGVLGRNDTSGGGIGVWSVSANGIGVQRDGPNGVYGTSSKTGYGAVYGKHTGSDGHGVVGDGTGGSAGMLGRNSGGIGVRGESSSDSLGSIEGHNDGLGSGVVGVGRVGVLAFSHVDGWNAAWGRHTTNGRGVAGVSPKSRNFTHPFLERVVPLIGSQAFLNVARTRGSRCSLGTSSRLFSASVRCASSLHSQSSSSRVRRIAREAASISRGRVQGYSGRSITFLSAARLPLS